MAPQQTGQELFGLDMSGMDEVLVLISILLIFIGLFLAFAGRKVWKHVMSFVGAIVGGLIGFAIGVAVGGWIMGFIVGMLASIVGSTLFIFLARVGIGVVAGVLSFLVVAMLTGSALAALVAGGIAFVVTVAFIETAMGIVTAVVGGLLVGLGLLWLDLEMIIVVIGLLAISVFGAAFQMTALRDEEARKRAVRAASRSPVAAAMAPPEPPPMPGRVCPRCGRELTYIPEYNRYYCFKCQRYE